MDEPSHSVHILVESNNLETSLRPCQLYHSKLAVTLFQAIFAPKRFQA